MAVLKCYNSEVEFMIDDEDYDKVSQYRWFQCPSGIYGEINGKIMSLSRYVLGVNDKSKKVLRRNNRVYDYRKSNLFGGNIYHDRGDYYDVECFDGQCFKVSKDSYEAIKVYQWHIDKNRYAIAKTREGRVIKLHRLLLEVLNTPGVEVDHKNRDTLDNRLENLRLADRSLNCFNRNVTDKNTSGTIGVYRMSGYDNKWCAQINQGGQRFYLGSFDSLEAAAAARKAAEHNLYGIQ